MNDDHEAVARVLEPELMDTQSDAALYDAMDHTTVNQRFVSDLLAFDALNAPAVPRAIDLGSGTARIPIELCRQHPSIQVIAVDAAQHMQLIARHNITAASLNDRIELSSADVKTLESFPDSSFDLVISNTLLHHLAEPITALRQGLRVLRTGGVLFIRDLMRPSSVAEIDRLTELHAGNEPDESRELLRQSLYAALTLVEARHMVASCGLDPSSLQATSDRHWTLACHKPDMAQ